MAAARRSTSSATSTRSSSSTSSGCPDAVAGLALGIAETVLRILGNEITPATVVLVALLLISGIQFRCSRCGSTWSRTETYAEFSHPGGRRFESGSGHPSLRKIQRRGSFSRWLPSEESNVGARLGEVRKSLLGRSVLGIGASLSVATAVAAAQGPPTVDMAAAGATKLTIDGDWLAAGDGAVWLSDPAHKEIYRLDGQTGAVVARIRVEQLPCEAPEVAFGALWAARLHQKRSRSHQRNRKPRHRLRASQDSAPQPW